MFIEVPSLEFEELSRKPSAEHSSEIKKRVDAARNVQNKRYGGRIQCNAYMDTQLLAEYCSLSPACEAIMKNAFNVLNLTARSYDRILRVARTIADLDGSDEITPVHLAEAIQYRTYDFSSDKQKEI